MKKIFSLIATSYVMCLFATDSLVWQGKVNSDGTPTPSVKLSLGKKYKIQVSGKINLGKWRSGGKPLENDACFEFIAHSDDKDNQKKKLETIKNSLNINVCNGTYRQDHIYESPVFMAAQSGIHFWVYDTDYEDNSGELELKVINVKEENEG
jgi:hypothetical protein